MKRTLVVFLSCALLPALASAKADRKGAMSDQQFVDFAAQTDMTEAHLGQLAQEQAATQGIKDSGQTLTTDHTNDYTQLTATAGKANLTVPKGVDAKHDKMIAPFEKLHGAAFDSHFLHDMVAGHTAAIAVYKRESTDAQSADLKTYATNALPVLQKHLDDAKELEKNHGK
jgi:putative membrane protein